MSAQATSGAPAVAAAVLAGAGGGTDAIVSAHATAAPASKAAATSPRAFDVRDLREGGVRIVGTPYRAGRTRKQASIEVQSQADGSRSARPSARRAADSPTARAAGLVHAHRRACAHRRCDPAAHSV